MESEHPELDPEAVVSLFQAISRIKHLQRKGWVLRGIDDPESVASHSFGTALLALLISREMGLDPLAAVTSALIHDIAESIVGDVVPADGVDAALKAESEEAATARILAAFDGDGELLEKWLDFEYGRTAEGVLVKDLDRLDMALQALVYEQDTGKDLDDFFPYVEERLVTPEVRRIFQYVREQRPGQTRP